MVDGAWFISGIQQVGIGVTNVEDAFRWFRRSFGMDVPVFDDAGEAALMTPYTGGEVHSRRAILAANLRGGSAFEIWQFTSRTPGAPHFSPELGDLGIIAARIKTSDVEAAYEKLRGTGAVLLGAPVSDPAGTKRFYVRGPSDSLFEVSPASDWFGRGSGPTGGVAGCTIGVRDIDRSRELYSTVLGYDTAVYDERGTFPDWKAAPGGDKRMRRVLLKRSQPPIGAFGTLFGTSTIELVQRLDGHGRKVFEGRYWGDLGFIHLCFDVHGMQPLLETCTAHGFKTTVDSAQSFEMGDAAGRFAYIEDADGTLIEFVETHKMPILKKVGWYLDLRKRDARKPLPRWMVASLGLSRVHD